MSAAKRLFILLLRLVLASAAMFFAYGISLTVMGNVGVSLSPEEARQAGQALIYVAIANALVLSILVMRSTWSGLKLVAAVFLVQFGVETFMAQIETLYYNSAVQMAGDDLIMLVVAGAVRALVFAPLAVLIFG